MYRTIAVVLFVFLVCSMQAQTSPTWFGHYGGTLDDFGQASCFDNLGNYYLAGSFKGSFNVGTTTLSSPSHQALFIVKFNNMGQVLWAIQSGSSASTTRTVTVSGMVADAFQHLYITGYYGDRIKLGSNILGSNGSDDIFTACLDHTGAFVWAASLGGSNSDRALAICAGSDGLPLIAGFYGSVLSTSLGTISCQGVCDILVARYNSDGSLSALGHWGSSLEERALSIAALPDGACVISGYYNGSISFGEYSLTAGGREAYICKLDNSLDPQWVIGTSGTGSQKATALTARGSSIYCLGQYNNAFSLNNLSLPYNDDSLFYAEFDLDGNVQGLSHLGTCSSAATVLVSAYAAELGGVIAVGSMVGTFGYAGGSITSVGGSDAILVKVDANGNLVWVQQFGGDSYENALAIVGDVARKCLICGYYSEGASFDGQIPANAGLKDIFGYMFVEASPDIPASPQNITLQVSGAEVILSWNAVSTAETGTPLAISGYHVYYSATPEAGDFELLGSTTANSYLFSIGQALPDLRFFRVCAYCNP